MLNRSVAQPAEHVYISEEDGFVSSAAKAFFWGIFAAIGLSIGYSIIHKVKTK
jgi:hypothetical protein